MRRIIIYGIKNIELRRNIENFLDDRYEIVGYSDDHYTYDILDGRRFFNLDELREQEFDFILLCKNSATLQKKDQRNLMLVGIPSEKILKPIILCGKGEEKKQTDLIANIDDNYDGEMNLIFGLSYSAWGILEKNLRFPFYNCSWPGLDLYYNFGLYKYIEKRKAIPKIENILWVFPYYYFDYDMSRSIAQYVSGQIFSVRRLDDWHHAMQIPGAWEYVENYRMFGEKIAKFYHMPKWKYDSPYVLKDPDSSNLLDPIWFDNHEETVEENQEVFAEFYQKLKSKGGTPIIVIPPFYLRGLNPVSVAAFQAKREKFYSILKKLEVTLGKIVIFDYADQFATQRELFREVTHLNSKGAEAFTQLINRDILGRVN